MEIAMKFYRQKQSITALVHSWFAFHEEGQALVEFALVASMFLVLVTGILIFGMFEMQVMSLTEGVNSAGRVLAVSGGLTLDPCAAAVSAIQNAAPLISPSNLSYQIVLNPTPASGSSTNHTYTVTTCSSTSTTTGAPGYLVSGGSVTVTAYDNNCSLNIFGKKFLPNGCQIYQSISEVVQ
jgi:Flp pilus assembly protein TadG